MDSRSDQRDAPAPAVALPYVDRLLSLLDAGHPGFSAGFGRHVHWGYWPDPARASGTAEDFAAAAERLTEEVCAAAGVSDGQRILDVGCGLGGTIASLNERRQRVDLTGLNIDRRQLARARRTVAPRGGNTLRYLAGHACELPFADASFDTLLAVESIFHFGDRGRFVREGVRVLRPGGRLVLTDFVPLRSLRFKSQSFFGPINLRCSVRTYRGLAAASGLSLTVERDITAETLPTYVFLRALEASLTTRNRAARFQTGLLEALSRLRLLRYMILAFSVPERTGTAKT